MPIPFACPFCELETLVDDDFAGKSGSCAGCRKKITVPMISANAPLDHDEVVVGIPQGRQRSAWQMGAVVIAGALAGVAVGGVLLSVFFPAVTAVRGVAHRHTCQRNLQRIAEGLAAYELEHGALPPAYVADENGAPLYSWRVLLLPYLGEEGLYQEFKFSEPWDSPDNKVLSRKMPKVYACPTDPNSRLLGETNYMVIVGPRTLFPGEEPRRLIQVADDLESTIAVAETPASGVVWTEPKDLVVDSMQYVVNGPFGKEIASDHPGGAYALMADGEVRFISDLTPSDLLEAMTTISGGEAVPLEFLLDLEESF